MLCSFENAQMISNIYFGVWRSWGRFRALPVADEARNKEWQQLGDRRVSNANEDRALVATGSTGGQRHFTP